MDRMSLNATACQSLIEDIVYMLGRHLPYCLEQNPNWEVVQVFPHAV